jgi:hypothetical protein
MEAEAVREGIRLAHALEVINLVKEARTGRSKITSICQQIKELRIFFASFDITHVNKSANEAAHACARRVLSGIPRKFYFSTFCFL